MRIVPAALAVRLHLAVVERGTMNNRLARFIPAVAGFAVFASTAIHPGLFAQSAAGESYPSRPVRIVVPFPPAGTLDVLARVIGERLSPALGQPVLVENRPGAQGSIGADAVAKAAPDGHTLLLASNTFIILPSMNRNLPYDVFRDFTPVVQLSSIPNVLVVHPSFPGRTVQEFIAVARRAPGGLSYNSAGTGSPLHLAGELMAREARIPLVHVPYKGTIPAVNDLVSGQLMAMFAPLGAIMPFLKSGKAYALGVTDSQRTSLLPDVPTLREAGIPNIDAVSSWFAILGPARLPPAVVARLNAEFNKVLALREVRERLREQAFEILGGTSAELTRVMRDEFVSYGRIVADANIKMD